jgi:flagellar export protein FliJ
MGKFKFPLQALLKVSEIKKKQAELDYVQAKKRLDKELEIFSLIDTESKNLINKLTQLAMEGTRINKIRLHSVYLKKIYNQLNHQKMAVLEAQSNLDDKKTVLISLFKEIDVLNELKEKQFSIYSLEMEKKQQKTIDEFASYKAYQGGCIND